MCDDLLLIPVMVISKRLEASMPKQIMADSSVEEESSRPMEDKPQLLADINRI
jgi:hypothetical protein